MVAFANVGSDRALASQRRADARLEHIAAQNCRCGAACRLLRRSTQSWQFLSLYARRMTIRCLSVLVHVCADDRHIPAGHQDLFAGSDHEAAQESACPSLEHYFAQQECSPIAYFLPFRNA